MNPVALRRAHGEHYTAAADADALIAPLFACFDHPQHPQAAMDELVSLRVLDPACGDGALLGAAAAQMMHLARQLRSSGAVGQLSGSQFVGIELLEDTAAKAERCLEHLGLGKPTIMRGDALALDWPTDRHTWIVANPPYIGAANLSPAQADGLLRAWGCRPGLSNYATGWMVKAARSEAAKAAFLVTEAVVRGGAVDLLADAYSGWRRAFASSPAPWAGDAVVSVVVIGFDREQGPALLDGRPVRTINRHLRDAPDVALGARPLPTNGLPPWRMGSKPVDGGHLIVAADDLARVRADEVASRILHPFVMGHELLYGEPRGCLWSPDGPPQSWETSPVLADAYGACAAWRAGRSKAETVRFAATPWRFNERRQPGGRYLAVPKVVAENRRWLTATYLDADVIAGDKVYVCDADPLAFAVISSRAFWLWQRAVGGTHAGRVSFTPTVSWNSFPLPGCGRAELAEAGAEVWAARDDRPLAAQYEAERMTGGLAQAHVRLDCVMDRLLGLAQRDDDRRLVRLFDLAASATSERLHHEREGNCEPS